MNFNLLLTQFGVFNPNISWVNCYDDNNKDIQCRTTISSKKIVKDSKVKDNKNLVVSDFSLDNTNVLIKLKTILELQRLQFVSTYELLEYETLLMNYCCKYISQSNDVQLCRLLQLLKKVQQISEILIGRVRGTRQMKFTHNCSKTHVVKSSYNFCKSRAECKFNYSNFQNGCYQHHYVHNNVYADITSLIQYLENVKDDDIESFTKKNRNVHTCISTLAYVTKHMYEELNIFKLYERGTGDINSKIEKFHVNNHKHRRSFRNRRSR